MSMLSINNMLLLLELIIRNRFLLGDICRGDARLGVDRLGERGGDPKCAYSIGDLSVTILTLPLLCIECVESVSTNKRTRLDIVVRLQSCNEGSPREIMLISYNIRIYTPLAY